MKIKKYHYEDKIRQTHKIVL